MEVASFEWSFSCCVHTVCSRKPKHGTESFDAPVYEDLKAVTLECVGGLHQHLHIEHNRELETEGSPLG